MGKGDYTAFSDGELVKRYLAGDERSFVQLHGRHTPPVTRYIAAKLYDASNTEDVLQTTWYRTVKALPRFDQEKSFHTWFFTVATREIQAVNLKQRRSRLVREVDLPSEDFLCRAYRQDHGSRADLSVQQLELEQQVDSILASMSPNHAEILRLRYLEENLQEEVAQKLNISVGSVKSRTSRAAEQLREKLPDYIAELRVA